MKPNVRIQNAMERLGAPWQFHQIALQAHFRESTGDAWADWPGLAA
jgi:hypothetical protein